ncbi:MAG: hypothetical protein FWE72_01805 [Spirochaetaceae bacterium]|nr:hypothetical protein [Spirochaetaceae bacterium]
MKNKKIEITTDIPIDEEDEFFQPRGKWYILKHKWVLLQKKCGIFLRKYNFWSRNTIILLIILNIIVLSAIAVLIYQNTVQKKQFNYSLSMCDLNISRGAYETAETILQNLLPFAVSKSDHIKILKRSDIIADKTDNYQKIILFSEKAFNKFNKDEELFSIHIYFLIKNRNFTKAISLIDNNKLRIPESLSNVIYAIKYKQDKNQDILLLIKNKDIKNIIEGNTELALYEQMYNKSQKPVVLNNYLLSILLTGDYKKAAAVLDKNIYKNQIDNELSGLVFYDNKDYQIARDIFYKLYQRMEKEIVDAGIIMLLADTLIHTGSYKEAYDLYDIIILNDSKCSWIPYVNKDWINMVSGEKSFYTEEAIDLFKNEKELTFLFILKNQHYDIKEARRNQDKYIAEFWDYYIENSMTDEFKIFFLKELYRMGRLDEIFLFTEKRDNVDKEWSLFFNAIALFSKKEYTNALVFFQQYYDLTNSWQGLYNIGIIHLLNLNYEYASNYFELILKNDLNINNYDLTDIYLMLSLSLTMDGEYKKGEFYLNKTLETGSSSIISSYLQNYYKSK